MVARKLSGLVIKIKDNCVATILVKSSKFHKKYGKQIRSTKKFHARFTKPVLVRDAVQLKECRPFAKTVHWIVVN